METYKSWKVYLTILLVIVFLYVGLFAVLVVSIKFEEIYSRIDKSITLLDETRDKFKVEIHGGMVSVGLQPTKYLYTISVKYKKTVIYSFESRESKKQVREYLKEIKIEKEYHNGDVHAYKFPWAIIYSLDNKGLFYSVGEENYEKLKKEDPEFKEIYDLLH